MRFFRAFLASLLLFIIGYLLLVVLMDPRGDFHTGRFPVVIMDSREVKMHLFLAENARAPIQGLILGSSRSMKLNPADFAEMKHLRFFNFAVDNARTEDYLAIYRWVRRQGARPKILVIGLDVEALHNDDQPDERLTRNDLLYREVNGKQPLIPALDAPLQGVKRYKRSFTNTYAGDVLKSVLLVARHADTTPAMSFEKDGYLRYVRWERMKRAGTFDLQKEIAVSIAEYGRRLHTMTGLSHRRKQQLTELIREVKADGGYVAIWLTNLHPEVTDQLAKTTAYPLIVQEIQAYLKELNTDGHVCVRDYHDPRLYGGSLTDWYDGAHVGEMNARLIVAGLLKGCKHQWSSIPTSSYSSSSPSSLPSSGSLAPNSNGTYSSL
ncbi:MAG TPA: hypothetical protein VGM23_13790 [Armatimonadota bacterium]|jgi:hypothetical protein